MHAKGYVMVRVGGRYRPEHVLVMEEALGRSLLPGETVHHRYGVKCDNRLENLELWAKPQPSGVRARDLLEWARQVVARYEPIEDLL